MNEHDELPDNDRAATPASGIEQNIVARVGAVAGAVDLGDPAEMLDTVRAAATTRRRRRQGVGAIAAVGALGLSGVVLVTVSQGNDGDLVVSAPVTDPVVESESDDEVESGGSAAQQVEPAEQEDTADDTAEDAPVTSPGVLRVTPSSSEMVSDAGLVIEQEAGFGQLYPWQGGFLSIRETARPQPLPLELPESVTEKFPPEVQELFPDGLPPTIAEATEILQEAGLFEVVSEIVLADPDVSAAIYSQQSEVVQTIRFSEDGIEWRDIDTAFPEQQGFGDRTSTGERFVLTSSVYPDGQNGPNRESPTSVNVWSSTDLVEWEQQVIPLPELDAGLPDFITYDLQPTQMAANDSGWVLPFYSFVTVDDVFLIDDEELLAQIDAGERYTSSYFTETGVIINVYDPSSDDSRDGPDVAAALEFTWAELGVDSIPASLRSGLGEQVVFSAAWGADPVRSPSVDGGERQIDRVHAVRDGFVSVGNNIELSIDGVNWSPVGLPVDGYVNWVLDTENGLLIAVSGNDQEQVYSFDAASSEFTSVDLEGLPPGVSPQQTGPGLVVLAQYEEVSSDSAYGPGGSLAAVEVEGYRFELSISGALDDGPLVSYTVTDLATGDVVSTESLVDGSAEFEFATEEYDGDIEGFRVFDPATGDELFFATFESMTYTPLDEAGEALEPVDGSVFDQEFGPPATFLLAAVGDQLIVEQLSEPDDDEFYYSSAATNGDVVLVANVDGSFRRLTPTG